MNGDRLIARSIHVHPVFLLGVAVSLVAAGSVLSQTLFIALSSITGVSVLLWSVVWLIIAGITMLLGWLRSFRGEHDAR